MISETDLLAALRPSRGNMILLAPSRSALREACWNTATPALSCQPGMAPVTVIDELVGSSGKKNFTPWFR
jgi:hypothetical protein